MGRKEIYVSDLTDQQADQDDLEELVVLDHPEHGEIVLEVLTTDVAGLTEVEDVFITVEWQGMRRIVRLDDFNQLATHMPMDDVLKEKAKEQRRSQSPQQGRRRGRARSGGGRATRSTEKIDYGSPQHAGDPHRGRATEAEAQYVRDNLDAVNARLAKEDKRTIDPNHPKMRERFGLSPTPVPSASR